MLQQYQWEFFSSTFLFVNKQAFVSSNDFSRTISEDITSTLKSFQLPNLLVILPDFVGTSRILK